MRALEVIHDQDPKEAIWKEIKPYIAAIEPMLNEIIIVTYERPAKTKGGIILADNTRREDRYQGKLGLLVKMGPLAFQDSDDFKWGDRKPKIGDWVAVDVNETWQFVLGSRYCRQLRDAKVKQIVVGDPDILL